MSTKADKIMSEIAAVENERAALVERQQAVERALAEPGAPSELAAELVTLGARIKAAAVRLRQRQHGRGQRRRANAGCVHRVGNTAAFYFALYH